MLRYIRKFAGDVKDRGASAVEYGLMVAAIAAVIVAIVFGLGGLVRETFQDTCASIDQGAGQTLDANCAGGGQQQPPPPPP
jgi:pilus assembly protein Flp/PilA